MSIMIDLLGVFTDLTPAIIDIYISLFGVPCDVYYAIQEDRFFDDHAKPKYGTTPSMIDEQILIVNFIKNNAMRGNLNQFESFFGEGDERPYIVTHEAKRLPPRTRIDAKFLGAVMSFQTEIDTVVTGVKTADGTHSTIMVKQILRPLT